VGGLLVVVAHPDDETFGCGSVIASAVARGETVVVACLTAGELGEPAPGFVVCPDGLGADRSRELREAAAILGVSRVELLGFVDSGWDGDPAPDSLCGAADDDVIAAIGRVLDDVAPDRIVVLDGSDGHRDHVRSRDMTLAALDRAGARFAHVRVDEMCLARSLMRRWADEMRALKPESVYLDVDEAAIGRPDEEITDVVDASAHVAVRERAIAAHRSQVSPFEGLSPELRRAFLTTDHLVRLR
jgi:N-acetyl-1-D-myo-inositol-2-amino-2-deoxy-alpha-D-glucopyranoside deacetylase